MKTQLNQKKYYSEVKRALNCSHKEKKQILNNLKSDVADYCEEYPEATESQIRNRFGEPSQYATEFLATLDKNELQKKFSLNRLGFKFLILCILISILALAITIFSIIIGNKKGHPVYYSEEISYEISLEQNQ